MRESDFLAVMADYARSELASEKSLMSKLTRASILGLIAFCAGLIALVYSHVALAALLLMLALHWNQQTHTYHLDIMLMKESRRIAQLVVSVAERLGADRAGAGGTKLEQGKESIEIRT
jgi:hypothetical protein